MKASGNGLETQRLEVHQAPQRVEILTADAQMSESMIASIDAISERIEQTERILLSVVDALAKVVEAQNVDREAFTAALTASANRPDPVVNVSVPVPEVKVTVPKPRFNIQNPTPVVNVTMPASKKTITFERDFNGDIKTADIQEE